MKIVHTADWHVGKSIRGKHRSDEFRAIFQELKEFLQQKNVDILLVAGDIFDSNAPSAEAEEIVYAFFHEVIQVGTKLIVIAGNHDSGLRFEAISNLAKLGGIYIKGTYSCDVGYEIFWTSKTGENAHIITLPFISENVFIRAEDLAQKASQENMYSQGYGKLLQTLAAKLESNALKILAGHVLIHGAKAGGGERRLYMGNNYAVSVNEIPTNIDYVALGHIHLQQRIQGPCPIYYCGSPLQMDFGEANHPKGFLYLDTTLGNPIIPEFIEFKNGKKLLTIQATLDDLVVMSEKDPSMKSAYLKVTVHTDTESRLGLAQQVKKMFPNAVDIRREYSQTIPVILPTSDWLPKLYQEYLKKEYDDKITPETMVEFQKLYEKFKK